MVTIQETDINEKAMAALTKAKKSDRPILVSVVNKIDDIDPLLFFQQGKEQYSGERFLWKDPEDETVLVGMGIAKQIQSDQISDRFFHVEKEWQDFLSEALIYNSFDENGIGPLIFGGFSFDPLKPKTDLWSEFSHSQFHVPMFMLSIVKGNTFLTTNIICSKHDDTRVFQETAKKRQDLFSNAGKDMNRSSARLTDTNIVSPQKWRDSVDEVVQDLKNGPLKKVVLARELRLIFDQNVASEKVLDTLFKEQHHSYIFAFESNGDCFIGASPERLIKKQGDNVFSTCLAGSIPRGKTPEDDEILGEQLLDDRKNRMEHQYVVDMIKEALEESCEDLILPDQPRLMKLRNIQHLYTPVIGKCKKDASLLLLVERLHPTPALGGLPKKEAVEKIRQVEELDRGFYAAPLGWIDYQGNGEFAVSIRSGIIQGKEASLFAGCGIVADSDPESEFLETALKFRPMLTALGGK